MPIKFKLCISNSAAGLPFVFASDVMPATSREAPPEGTSQLLQYVLHTEVDAGRGVAALAVGSGM